MAGGGACELVGTSSGIDGLSPKGSQGRLSREMDPREEMASQPQLSQGRLKAEDRDEGSSIDHSHLANLVMAVVSQQLGGKVLLTLFILMWRKENQWDSLNCP